MVSVVCMTMGIRWLKVVLEKWCFPIWEWGLGSGSSGANHNPLCGEGAAPPIYMILEQHYTFKPILKHTELIGGRLLVIQ